MSRYNAAQYTYSMSITHALGISRETESLPPRQPHKRYLLGDRLHLTPWSRRFRFGWVLVIRGPYWQRGYGVVGPDWNGGKWLGGMSWRRYGPVAVCGHRIRGSWRGDRISARLAREFEAKYGSDD